MKDKALDEKSIPDKPALLVASSLLKAIMRAASRTIKGTTGQIEVAEDSKGNLTLSLGTGGGTLVLDFRKDGVWLQGTVIGSINAEEADEEEDP